MTIQSVLVEGSDILREVAPRCTLDMWSTTAIPTLAELIQDMKDTLKEQGGIGLAAPQIGVGRRIILVCKGGKPDGLMQAFINPELELIVGRQMGIEGCLSVPGKLGEVERAFKVRIKALSPNGKQLKYTASGLEAACIQHEIDHLDGVLFTSKVKGDIVTISSRLETQPAVQNLPTPTV